VRTYLPDSTAYLKKVKFVLEDRVEYVAVGSEAGDGKQGNNERRYTPSMLEGTAGGTRIIRVYPSGLLGHSDYSLQDSDRSCIVAARRKILGGRCIQRNWMVA
jgi:hypothetical protein